MSPTHTQDRDYAPNLNFSYLGTTPSQSAPPRRLHADARARYLHGGFGSLMQLPPVEICDQCATSSPW